LAPAKNIADILPCSLFFLISPCLNDALAHAGEYAARHIRLNNFAAQILRQLVEYQLEHLGRGIRHYPMKENKIKIKFPFYMKYIIMHAR
jgi:hypothetical protein